VVPRKQAECYRGTSHYFVLLPINLFRLRVDQVTSDSGLKGRCKRQVIPSSGCDVVSISSETFVEMIDSCSFPSSESSSAGKDDADGEYIAKYLDGLESTVLDQVKGDIDAQVALARQEMYRTRTKHLSIYTLII